MICRTLAIVSLLTISFVVAAGAEGADATVAPNKATPWHPIVASFERFSRQPADEHRQEELIRGGRLLVGELNCTSCHATSSRWTNRIVPKTAPVLSDVGSRVKADWLRAFLTDPRHVKPGTTMPNVLASLRPEERTEQVEALVHFLVATGDKQPIDQASDPDSSERGKTLYHQVGCVACHGSRDAERAVPLATSIPLGNVGAKYTVTSLTSFLRDPLAVRPSGRMPNLNLSEQDARDLGHFFLKGTQGAPPNLCYTYYEGSFESVRNIDIKKPKSDGQCLGFDLSVARRTSDMALRFKGFLRILEKAEYTFYLTSDDGSRLNIDDMKVVENDGEHSRTTKSGTAILDRGMHEFDLVYFNVEGDRVLEVEYESEKLPRRDVSGSVSITEDVEPAPTVDSFKTEDRLVARGRELFASVGCASCHTLRESDDEKPIASTLKSRKLAELDATKGCLNAKPRKSPNFALDDRQREAIAAALAEEPSHGAGKPSPQEVISTWLVAFNCLACHARDGVGGVEPQRNDHFASTIKEMGDEGRLPPPLTGAGAKLQMSWLRNLVDKGVKDRPYMLTRMPAFGIANVKPVLEAMAEVDKIEAKALSEFTEPSYRVKDQGRFLVGSKAFGCVKCHTFDKYKAEGIQSIDMTTMTRRLQRDWFLRYLREPLAFRPGTRMPAAWPKEGKSYLPKVFEGDSDKQISAVWTYLLDGTKAAPPAGVGGEPIELIPTTEPIVFRGFLEGVGPRGIAVGFPSRVNYAFDADHLRLATVWKGQFLDASKNWTGRGGGFITPLGDGVTPLPEGVAFAKLDSPSAPWPEVTERSPDYQFLGYYLQANRQPWLKYRVFGTTAQDSIQPVIDQEHRDNPSLVRQIVFHAGEKPPRNLWMRAAAGELIEPKGDGWYLIDRTWQIRLSGADRAKVRTNEGHQELIVPIVFWDERVGGPDAVVIEIFKW
ncbi:MAG TPA: PA14 domain-containing protein [Pirellulales bacterium]|nr:PA14 domain-containing protein [Pirellulales bacterium]